MKFYKGKRFIIEEREDAMSVEEFICAILVSLCGLMGTGLVLILIAMIVFAAICCIIAVPAFFMLLMVL